MIKRLLKVEMNKRLGVSQALGEIWIHEVIFPLKTYLIKHSNLFFLAC